MRIFIVNRESGSSLNCPTKPVRTRFGYHLVLVEDRKRATRLGANAYLVKTEFHSESLLEVVRRFVNLRG